ncbi:hypothetical protein J1N35_010061 [Gossypium stocksii]|uniref:Uncharacterized protein n=1 Tax=Gossypium stocksii TaxID=47602 RepID=A0A9D3W1M9_9ROSI|nr:hypothetical protein J1N35_010061 [Gossypium stocksii]
MFIKSKDPADVRGSIEHYENVQEILTAIEKQFKTSQKSLASTLIMKFTSMKLITVKGVCDHINKTRDLVAQLRGLEVEMFESFPEEARLILDIGESALMVTQGKKTVQAKQKGKAKMQS